MKIDWDRGIRGYEVTKVAAVEAKDSVGPVAEGVGDIARSLLRERHNKTYRLHDLPPPEIEVERLNSLDWVVWLTAEGEDGVPDEGRAVGIEFGHQYESVEQNPSGPWNESAGLHVLRDAGIYASLTNGG